MEDFDINNKRTFVDDIFLNIAVTVGTFFYLVVPKVQLDYAYSSKCPLSL